jgi:hypothetical protein
VATAAAADPDARRLMTHPGVGPLTALATVLVLGPVGRFPGSKHVVSYIGLAPAFSASADKYRLGHISKQGSALLSEGNINAPRALAPPPLRPVPRRSRPQPRTPPPPLEPQAQRTSASGRAHRARPAVSGMLGAHTVAVKRQMNRPDQHERRLAAQARRRPSRPRRVDQGTAGAGPGLGPERAIPRCAGSFQLTAGSCRVAIRRK